MCRASFVCLALLVVGCRDRKREELAAVKERVAKEEAAWNAAHPVPSATIDASPLPSMPDTPIGDVDEPGRAMLLRLANNPLAVKPKKITPPDNVEPHTTYEYAGVDALGDVIQWRTSARAWQIFLPNRARPEIFALPSQLKELDKVGRLVQWWRITDGPLKLHFVMRSGDNIELESFGSVCDHPSPPNNPTPMVAAECGYH